MTGWTSITAVKEDRPYGEVKDEFEDEVDGVADLHKVMQTRALEWGTKNGVGTSVATVNGGHRNAAYIRFGGYREWAEDISFVENNLLDIAERVVIIHANDTSDTGRAKLFKKEDGVAVFVDQYEEEEALDGRPVGEKAAAYMYLYHDVPAVAHRRRQYEHIKDNNYDEL